jgi:F-type H+-transporting ATPase subunit a
MERTSFYTSINGHENLNVRSRWLSGSFGYFRPRGFRMDRIPKFCFFLLAFSFLTLKLAAKEGEEHPTFNTVDYLFEHVNDSHEWYFLTIGNHHISIPLPIILHSKATGWHLFSSSKLYHAKSEQYAFYIAHGGKNDGKIVERHTDGSESIPIDLSITKTVLGALIVALILIVVLITVARHSSKDPLKIPKGIQNLVEPIVLFVRDEIAKPFAGEKYKRFLPYLLTVFLFVLLSNLVGLILPLGFNITGNIAVTVALGSFTFVITLVSGNKKYWMHIINPDVPVFMKLPIPLMPVIEIAGVLIKPMILMIRLFANMFAGHVIIAVLLALIFIMSALAGVFAGMVTSVVSIIFSIFILLLDLLVSFIQAYIFTLLSAMYFGMATEKSHH